jgi:hypothetical protein
MVDPGAHLILAREREQHAEDDSHEQQRQEHPSRSARLSRCLQPAYPVQTLQVLHSWIPRHPRWSWPLACGRVSVLVAVVPGGIHRI